MSLTTLPIELLLDISENLEFQKDFSSLGPTSKQFYSLLSLPLYQNNAKHHGSSALTWAANNLGIRTAENALAAGADVNCTNQDSVTPLLIAACTSGPQAVQMAKLLLENGADVDAENARSKTRLMQARMDEAMLRLLVEKGVTVNHIRGHQWTPLVIAAMMGNEVLARLLIGAGARINWQPGGPSPLTTVVMESHMGMVRLLVEHGADVNIIGYRGRTTALITAIGVGHEGIVRLFLEIPGIDTNIPTNAPPLYTAIKMGWRKMVRLLIDHGADVNCRDMPNTTPLLVAIESENSSMAELLIDAGADLNPVGFGSISPLTQATLKNRPAVSRLLLEWGADIHHREADGRTALFVAITENNHEALGVLLSTGEIDMNPDAETAPMTFAARCAKLPVVRALVEYGANVNRADENGETTLHRATQRDDREMVQYLIDNGADVHFLNLRGRTPLMVAARCGHRAMIQLLVENGADADINSVDLKGRTPLHHAVKKSRKGVVSLLFALKADLSIADKDGLTPVEMAKSRGFMFIDIILQLYEGKRSFHIS